MIVLEFGQILSRYAVSINSPTNGSLTLLWMIKGIGLQRLSLSSEDGSQRD